MTKKDALMIKVVIASNLVVLREGAKRILSPQADIDVIAEVAHLQELSSNNALLCADVLIVIADTPSVDGNEHLSLLNQERPSLRVVILLRFPTLQQILSILRTGVRGLLSASSAASHLPTAVRAISSGRLYLNDELTRLLIPDHRDISKDYTHRSLTDRELEIFLKLAAGKKVSEIAAQLGISSKTVSTHKSRLMEKMHMTTFSQIVQYAIAYGLCDPSHAG
ncbi:MAG: response regulator transcription factor [Pseudomonadota bacterium]